MNGHLNGTAPEQAPTGTRCLIVGAGEAGRTLALNLRRVPEFGLIPVGFLDDNPGKRRVAGLPVLGRTEKLREVVVSRAVAVVILAIPALEATEFRRLANAAAMAGVAVRYLPSFLAAIERDARVSDLRHLRVERLLGRAEVHMAGAGARSVIEGKRVLVSGAGGSIGSELCRQIAAFDPAALYFLDHDESNLHQLLMEISGKGLLLDEELLIADIRDEPRIRQILSDLRPHVVFHAAAHKHLPLLERHPCEGVKSNVLGTHHLVRAATEVGVERFILISTDKAADPTSVLGMTKRLAEMIVATYAGQGPKFASVRFGNVLGSRGSLLSVLSRQFESSEAFTVTHPEVTRFFMTIEEAVGLVLEAAKMAAAGETFVLDMGDPVRIVDLVRNYAAEMHMPSLSVNIEFTGLRPGEKLNETLFGADEEPVATAHPRIMAVKCSRPEPDLLVLLERLGQVAVDNRDDDVRALLAEHFPTYRSTPASSRELLTAGPYPDGF